MVRFRQRHRHRDLERGLGQRVAVFVPPDDRGSGDLTEGTFDRREPAVGVGHPLPVAQPLRLVASQDVPLGAIRLRPAVTLGLVKESDHVTEGLLGHGVRLLVLRTLLPTLRLRLFHLHALWPEAGDFRRGDGLFQLPAPLADQVVRAKDDGPVLATRAPLLATPLSVLVGGEHSEKRLPGSHLANDKAVTNPIEHLDGGGDHVCLSGERLAVVGDVVEVRQRIAEGNVERGQGVNGFLAEDLAVVFQVAIHRVDLADRQDLELRVEIDQCPIFHRVVRRVGTDRLGVIVDRLKVVHGLDL